MIPELKVGNNEQSSNWERQHYKDKVCLIDADFLKYYVVKDVYDYIQSGNEDPVHEYGLNYLDTFVHHRVNQITEKFEAKAYVFFFSGSSKDTYRYFLATEKEYKGNRKAASTYDYANYFNDMAEVMNVVSKRYTTFVHANMEADDLISIVAGPGTFIYSYDKDLRQIPGDHYDINTNQMITISRSDALLFICYQLLIGDSTDNISGIPGEGPKTADSFLKEIADVKKMPFKVIYKYVRKYGIIEGIDRFCETWMLIKLRINRGDYLREQVSKEIETINKLVQS